MKTKLLYVTVAFGMVLGLASCNLDYFPSDELNGSVLMGSEKGAEYIIDGCYTMLKEEYDYLDYASSNTYIRHYLQDAEFPSDNICLSGHTTDPLYQATCYKMTSNLKNIGLPWWVGYKVIYTANSVIEQYKEGESASCDQLLGEAYFLRAMVHFHLVCLCAKPYVCGRENKGIPLRISTNTDKTTRATVGEVYDQVVADLIKASELMNAPRHGGNPGYATKNTALGLLSRVYLYMEENEKVIDAVDQMGSPELDGNFENYFANALNSKETLLAIAHTSLENRGSGSIGSMYTSDGGGWGEVYASDPLMNLYNRNPQDKRLSYIQLQIETDSKQPLMGKPAVFFPVPGKDDFRDNTFAELKSDASGKYCEIKDESGTAKKYQIKEVKVNAMSQPDSKGEYTLYYVTYGGEECEAHLYDKFPVHRNTFPKYFVTKFSYQDGEPMLSSPVLLRWGEVVLNRAEAYAKMGNTAKALEDVNLIRNRAGIPAMEAGNLHGYTDILDVVLDERRMELSFEGHRMFDVYRNRRTMDRRYAGVQPWEEIDYTADKIQFPIPYGETSVSGIDQNPGY